MITIRDHSLGTYLIIRMSISLSQSSWNLFNNHTTSAMLWGQRSWPVYISVNKLFWLRVMHLGWFNNIIPSSIYLSIFVKTRPPNNVSWFLYHWSFACYVFYNISRPGLCFYLSSNLCSGYRSQLTLKDHCTEDEMKKNLCCFNSSCFELSR